MIINRIFIALLCSACVPQLAQEPQFSELEFQIRAEEDANFIIKAQKSSVKDLQKHIKLLTP